MKEKVIQAEELTKAFGDFKAVNRITFEVNKGEVFGFLGANGAGKTTAMKMLIGISRPSSGKASVAGYQVGSQSELIKQNIGYMSQRFALYDDLNIKENINFFGGVYGLKKQAIKLKYDQLMDELNLRSSTRKKVGSLPLGWKQKLAFSTAMIHEPKIVFLDEPTGGVDPITRRQFWELIYKAAANGTTIFVTTHYMDEAEYCDRISIMVQGRIKALDRPAELKKRFEAANIDEVFLKLAR